MKTRNTFESPLRAFKDPVMGFAGSDAPKLLILPEDRSPEARICTLAHPRTSTPCRYYFDPEKGVYEFTKVAAPKSVCRSWLIGLRPDWAGEKAGVEGAPGEPAKSTPLQSAEDHTIPYASNKGQADRRPISAGYVMKNAEVLVATPIDPLFLILPSFASNSSTQGLFLSVEDLLDNLSETSPHLNRLMSHDPIRKSLEKRMRVVCDSVDAGDELMYRLNEKLLLDELLQKANRMVVNGLPASMEEKFVRRALESPIALIKHESSSLGEDMQNNASIISEKAPIERTESEASTASQLSERSITSTTTEITVPDESDPNGDDSNISHLLRIRTALSYMISAYISPILAAKLESVLGSKECPMDFKPLDERLASLAKARAEALAARSFGDFSRKRSMYEDDEATESKAEKKRKKEEEEKRKKASESKSIRDLKKVDTKGMKKMSDFFGKGAAAKKK